MGYLFPATDCSGFIFAAMTNIQMKSSVGLFGSQSLVWSIIEGNQDQNSNCLLHHIRSQGQRKEKRLLVAYGASSLHSWGIQASPEKGATYAKSGY